MHVIGDSHVMGFEALETYFPRYKISMCCVQGATASGLQNPHSTTLAGPIINEYVEKNVKPKDAVLVHLGEVDCGFLMWVRAERNGISIEDQTELTLSNYFSLLSKIGEITTDVFVLSIVPQTIKDGSFIENVANLRGHISATQKERTALSIQMNRRLHGFAGQHNLRFIDLDSELIDQVTGVVKDFYLNENAADHHLSAKKLIPLIASAIRKLRRPQTF